MKIFLYLCILFPNFVIMKRYPLIAFGLLVVFVAVFGFCSSSLFHQVEVVSNDSNDSIMLHIHWISTPMVPEKVEFAGEPMPLDFFDVRESLERELIVNTNFHSNTLQCIKRISRYFPVIEPILAANGIPDDFKYLALIESDLMNKVSPKGATGFWQFMKDTASEYKLEVNAEIDERYHLEKSTLAACNYLNEAYQVFNNWTMVAASYNMGKNGLSAQVKRQQCNSYYDLLLNDETARYIYRIAAMKIIMSDPKKYGFLVPDNEKYQPVPFTEVEIKTTVTDWVEFASIHQTNYKILKYLNPWLRDNKLTNTAKKTYRVKIPAEGIRMN